MIKQRIIYLLALAGSIALYLVNQQWFSWILLLIVAVLPWISLLLSFMAMKGLSMRLDVAGKIPIGCPEKATLKVTSKLPLPPYKSKLLVTKPVTGERWKLKAGANLPTEHCGKLRVELYKPGVFDYLGLLRHRIRDTAEQTVLVMPQPVEMEIPQSLNKHLEPRWQRKHGGGYAENHEIRQYIPGDNLNQIHWKLSAKVGELMIREPMVPERGLFLLTMDLNDENPGLDRKLGQFLWMSRWLLEREIFFELRVLTDNGIEHWPIRYEVDVERCIIALLGTAYAREGSIRDVFFKAAWRHHIGGEQDEA